MTQVWSYTVFAENYTEEITKTVFIRWIGNCPSHLFVIICTCKNFISFKYPSWAHKTEQHRLEFQAAIVATRYTETTLGDNMELRKSNSQDRLT